MPLLPRLAPWYRLVEDGDRLLLEHGRSVVVLEGGAVRALLPALLPLLDGSRTLEEIVATARRPAAGPRSSRRSTCSRRTICSSTGRRVLGHGREPAVAAAYGIAPAVAADRLRAATVGVVGGARRRSTSRGCSTPPASARFAGSPGTSTASTSPWSRRARRGLPASRVERLALEHGIRWLALRPVRRRSSFAIGPLVVPGESCCHECLQLRLAAHVEYGADLALIEAVPTAASATAGLEAVAAGLVAHLALCWLGGLDTRLPGVLHVLETRPELALGTHAVLRVPRCPACSDAERLAPPLPWHEAEAA